MTPKPTLRVLDAERHVDTEPVAEYWIPKRKDTTPDWARTYQKLTGGFVIITGAAGMAAGLTRQLNAMVTESTASGAVAVSISETAFSGGMLLVVVGGLVMSVGISMVNTGGDAA